MKQKNKNCKNSTNAGKYNKDFQPTPGKYEKPYKEPCDLDEMIYLYNKLNRDDLIKSFEELHTYTDFICGSPNIKEAYEAETFCKSVHQYRVPKASIKEAWNTLTRLQLDELQNFEQVYAEVRKATKHLYGYGELAMFDFAQRYCYSRNIYPTVIFLHSGVAIGVNALRKSGFKIKVYSDKPGCARYVKLEDLPKSIFDLGTVHAENFLCIYKEYLEKLKWNQD